MFNNYLRHVLRQLRTNRGYILINVVGLAIGMAVTLVIGIWIAGEVAVDKSYPDRSRIVEIMQDQRQKGTPPGSPITYRGTTVSSALEPFLKNNYKDIFAETALFEWPGDGLLVNGDKGISRKGSWAEYSFPAIFGYHFLSGNAESMRDPSTALISRSTAIALYGTEKALGKTFKYSNQLLFTVGGVYEDQPQNSSFHNIDFFLPTSHKWMDWLTHNTDFNNHSCRMFARLAANTTAEEATARIKDLCTPYVKYSIETYTVLPFDQLYLHYDESDSVTGGGRIGFVRLIGIIGVFVLLLACINFMNLSTAQSEKRAKEVGIRKTLGSLRTQLISQFLGESLLYAFFAFVLAVGLVILSLPLFSQLSGKPMTIPWTSPIFWTLSIAITIITGLLAGSYPAFFLSAFRPIDVLKGKLSAGFKGSWLRNLLVVFQFAVSIILIAGTLVIYNQLRYIRSKDIGYNKDKLLTIGNIGVLNMQVTAFKNELLGISGISNATVTSYLPINGNRNSNAYFLTTAMDPKNAVIMQDWVVDEKYLSTLGIQLLSGRNFSPDFPTDSNAILINEIAAKALPTKELLNKKLYQFSDMEANKSVEKHIVGIIKNFNFNSLRDMVTPMALKLGNDGGSITVRLSSGNIPNVLAQVKNKWKALVPAEPFVYSFMDEEFNNQYRAEQKTGKIFISFAVLAIFIACLGLFGLAAYAAEQRTKEIGIRKVLGATISDITGMLSKDFLKLVLIASVIAFPVSWWAMYRWLQDFAYRVNIGWWIFFVSGMIVLFIVIFTVAFQAIKAAMANPVKSLRTE